MKISLPVTRVLAAAALLLVAACGSGDAGTAAPARSQAAVESDSGTQAAAEVDVRGIAYNPASLRVRAGTEVVWTNADTGVAHTVTSGTPGTDAVPGVSTPGPASADGAFAGNLPDAGATFTFEFPESGTFAYFCEIHPSMTAEVIVE